MIFRFSGAAVRYRGRILRTASVIAPEPPSSPGAGTVVRPDR